MKILGYRIIAGVVLLCGACGTMSRLPTAHPQPGEAYETLAAGGGLTWKSEFVTNDSTALNIRPVVPRGPRHKQTTVFWMHGKYRCFTDYATELKMGLWRDQAILIPS